MRTAKLERLRYQATTEVFAGELAPIEAVDVVMIRCNAWHTGAETDIDPRITLHNTG